MPFSSLSIRFQSAGMIPPPYTHFYTLTARPVGRQLAVIFSITYTDREELDEEDITGEGFTLHDDFAWEGQLGAAWVSELDTLVNRTAFEPFDENALGEEDDFLEVSLNQDNGQPRLGTPADPEAFLYPIQELIQAIFEAGGKEKPFELVYLHYQRTGDLEVRLNASFAERSLRLTRRQDRQDQTKPLPWATLQRVMGAVYAHDYNPDDSLPGRGTARPPKRDGCFLNLGGDDWYDITDLPDVQQALERL